MQQNGTVTEIDWSHRAESLLRAERRSLEMIAAGAPLSDILADVCTAIDEQAPGASHLERAAGGRGRQLSLARGWARIAGGLRAISPVEIGPEVGSCGTAAYHKSLVIVSDIATDPRWDVADYRRLALANGLCAAWSKPLVSKTGDVLGTFGMYYGELRTPTDDDLALIDGAAHVALIAIEAERAQAALRKALVEIKHSEERLRAIIDTIPAQAWRLHADGTIDYLNQRWLDHTGLSREQAYGPDWKGEPGREAGALAEGGLRGALVALVHGDHLHPREPRALGKALGQVLRLDRAEVALAMLCVNPIERMSS